jgi:hypothetical protein
MQQLREKVLKRKEKGFIGAATAAQLSNILDVTKENSKINYSVLREVVKLHGHLVSFREISSINRLVTCMITESVI